MKYIYVLASSENDDYYEQFLLSLASLRLHNPEAQIITLIDEKTKKGLTGKRSEYEKLTSEIKVINVPDEYTQKEASRWIKTSIHHYVSGDFIYIDCDTIITENLEFKFPENISIGAVLDTHVTLENHQLKKNFQKEDLAIGFSSSLKTNSRYNGGILLYRDNSKARDFYENWHSLWINSQKKGCSQDMPSLNQANFEMNNLISELNGQWNCQISHNGLPFLSNAKIIHYFATSLNSLDPAFKLASSSIIDSIKQTGILSPEIIKLLEYPKSAFNPITRILSDKTQINALDHSLYFKLIRFINRHFR